MLVVTRYYKLDQHIGGIQADLDAGIHADSSQIKI